MAEYIEREAVLKIIGDNCPHDKCGYNTEEEMGAGAACYYIMKDVENIPTADVVPKSEYDMLRKANIEIELKNQLLYDEGKNWYDEYQKIKADLKQEKKYKRASEKLADKYFTELQTAKAEVAREIFKEIEEMLISSSLLLDCIMLIDAEMLAELKKKYTGGEPNGQNIKE